MRVAYVDSFACVVGLVGMGMKRAWYLSDSTMMTMVGRGESVQLAEHGIAESILTH